MITKKEKIQHVENDPTEIGWVRSSSIGNKVISLVLRTDVHRVHIGMPLVIESPVYSYFSLVTDIYQPSNVELSQLAKWTYDKDAVTQFTDNPNMPSYETIFVDCRCLQRWKVEDNKIMKENFIGIPKALTVGKVANIEQINLIYADSQYKNYWFGALSSIEERDAHGNYRGIPIKIDEMISRPMGVFGGTGSGKSVTMRNLCKLVIQNPGPLPDVREKANASLIIFDIHDEYGYNIQSKEGERGLLAYEELKEKIITYTLDPKKWDNNVPSSLQCSFGYAKKFFIWKKNVHYNDISGILNKSDTFSDKMHRTIYEMSVIAEKHQKRKLTLGDFWTKYDIMNAHGDPKDEVTFYDVLLAYMNAGFSSDGGIGKKLSGTESSYDALCHRLNFVLNHIKPFINIESVNGKDCYDEMIDLLNNVKNPGIENTKSFLIHFGRFGFNEEVYDFISTLITRKLVNKYLGEENRHINEDQLTFRQAVVVVEEAHNAMGRGTKNIFTKIARETRKFGLTLWYVDQIPSSIDEEVVSQSAHRIIHSLNNSKDIEIALSGLDRSLWRPIVSNLAIGQCLVFGDMINRVPSVLRSYYASGEIVQEKKDRGMLVHTAQPSVFQLDEIDTDDDIPELFSESTDEETEDEEDWLFDD